ncbi:trafficking protein particle complex subunit 10 [Cercophora samala]|uniref:Trafficking protein particle complex subunit 10 n=1 Tax=Cercophora samala TaxID=330535 RepID=A0AA40D864_9PEZI|nr:trafficking protein particle complex subunit 10 [Cercophora samala]
MEQPFSSSKVTVEYFDPHDVYKLLAPGLIPRLPLRDLNWQSHAGPLRSINTLHIELLPSGADYSNIFTPLSSPNPKGASSTDVANQPARDDGFQTATIAGRGGSTEHVDSTLRPPAGPGKERRHQIPGLRRTPYLKVLLIRCDDNDTYKSTTKAEIKEWIKVNTPPAQGKTGAENHDAFEWLIIHVVLPNTVAATQPRTTGKVPDSSDVSKAATLKWRGGSTSLLEKLRTDFNGSGKGAVDRIRQIRIGVNDVPYSMLPRVVPAVPTGYRETEQDSEAAWADLIGKFKELILSSFDTRVTQYEEDIKERDGQRSLPGWNFCTFFILKEGLARGFESVGLVEDALVGYDELSVGLDTIIQEQAVAGSAEAHGGALLAYTPDLKETAQKALSEIAGGTLEFEEEEAVDLQSGEKQKLDYSESIPITSSKKTYRELILANNVSLFDFRCYIFARQISLLLRLGNAWSPREELVAKLKEQQEMVPRGVAAKTPVPKLNEEPENLLQLAEICKRTLEFVPAISTVMREDIIAAIMSAKKHEEEDGIKPVLDSLLSEVVDNMVSSFAFSVAQQILAQTSTKALPIPPSTLNDAHDQKTSIPDPKTTMHPARTTSLHGQGTHRPPLSPGFPSGRLSGSIESPATSSFQKAGLEELAARRAELYALSRNILEECGKKRGWSDGWSSVPTVGEAGVVDMEEISLDDDAEKAEPASTETAEVLHTSIAGVGTTLLRTALDNKDDFYRLYETLTDKALRHYTVAHHLHSVQACMADLAVLKFHLEEYKDAAFYFYRVIPFFGESSWALLELSMLVMYARCLKKLNKVDDYVNQALRQLLCKAAAAERDRLQQKSRFRNTLTSATQYPEASAITGFLADLISVSASLEKDVRIPLTSLCCDLALDGPPFYDEGQDSFSLFLDFHSLLVDEFEADSVSIRITSKIAGGNREIWLQTEKPVTIRPGPNKVRVQSTTMMAGTFEVDQVRLSSKKVLLHYERDPNQPVDKSSTSLKNPQVTVYQRASGLDVRLSGTKDLQLDKKKSLDLELSTGWNSVKTCEIKIRSATGGLRLVMSEAEVIGSTQATKAEGGTFKFGTIPANSSVKVRFPFTVEHDLLDVAVRAEVTYSTERGSFTFFKTSSVPISLAVEVNVQDIFKHNALFSRFAVSSASSSPLRLFKSELLGSEIFDTHFGQSPSQPVLIFPKQPTSLLYKITRKRGVAIGPKTNKTLYLKLYYSVLQDEIESLFEQTIVADLEDSPMREYSKLIVSKVLTAVQARLSEYDLEKAALLGELQTSFLASINWESLFSGLGSNSQQSGTTSSPSSSPEEDISSATLSNFMLTFLASHPSIPLPHADSIPEPNTIVIPVDIPPVAIVHTADLKISSSPPPVVDGTDPYSGSPTYVINQLLPATLHLKWTRIWDTDPANSCLSKDIEFGYEITAPGDSWLLGGRRKGHFIIPAVEDGDQAKLSSEAETEAEIPVVLVPLREGFLPWPGVEIREVKAGENGENSPVGGGGGGGMGETMVHCETDYRNLGETVEVVGDRGRVTGLFVRCLTAGDGSMACINQDFGSTFSPRSEHTLGRELGTGGLALWVTMAKAEVARAW